MLTPPLIFYFILLGQQSADLILVFRNILLHCQCFFNIKVHKLAVTIAYHTVALALAKNIGCIGSHNGRIESVLTGGTSATLHIA